MNENFTAIQARVAHWLSKINRHTQRYKESFTDKQTHWQTADAHIHVCTNKQRNTHRDRETSPQWPHWGHRKMAIVERWLLWEGVSAHVCMSCFLGGGNRLLCKGGWSVFCSNSAGQDFHWLLACSLQYYHT